MMIDYDNFTGNFNFPAPENLTYLANCSAVGCSRLRQQNGPPYTELPSYIRITATAVCAVILAFGTVGNVLVATVVWKFKELRNSTNLFLMNLSVADLLVLLVCVPPALVELHSMPEVWLLGEGMCKAVPYVQLTAAHASILTILAISFERYYAICEPLKAGYTCTQMRALAIICIIWLVAALLTSPVLMTIDYHMAEAMHDDTMVPVCLQMVKELWQQLYYMSIIGFLFVIPFLVLLVVYCHIAKHLMLGRRVLASSSEENQMRARKQVVFMLIAVVLSFFICLLPFRIFTVWMIITPQEEVTHLGMETFYSLLYFCRLLLYMNSAINPILYNAISSKFRSCVMRLLRCSNVRSRLLSRQITKGTTTSSTATTSGSVKKDGTLLQHSSRQLRVTVNSNCGWNAGEKVPKPESV
ncbi:QRFP-like peptide receptor [Parasteatoda tepidariorum]|uniref:QRFP-like peptide receptor n=1 Tax=Parasteatoda tepidariorum TaxID=114398 RepID=UPI00077FBD0C|nr:QRFP-like peptide receptor [Parasteatoda tepidariorum]